MNAFRALQFKVIAAGNSHNDTAMLGAADAAILFQPAQNAVDEFLQYPVVRESSGLAARTDEAAARIKG